MSGDPIYTEMIIEYSRNPSNFGKIADAHIHQHDSNPLCGDSIDPVSYTHLTLPTILLV